MITVKQTIKTSAIIDKMGLEIKDPNMSQEELGADLIMQVIKNLHKAENEIYELVSDIKNIPETDAQKVNIVEFIKELFNDTELSAFFKQAFISEMQK